jgi:hypothetical protein
LFDYAFAAATIAALPLEEQVRFADALMETILGTHCEDGGFLGTQLIGVAGETGMALAALNALMHVEPEDTR